MVAETINELTDFYFANQKVRHSVRKALGAFFSVFPFLTTLKVTLMFDNEKIVHLSTKTHKNCLKICIPIDATLDIRVDTF